MRHGWRLRGYSGRGANEEAGFYAAVSSVCCGISFVELWGGVEGKGKREGFWLDT
jgi:hypothetical protein